MRPRQIAQKKTLLLGIGAAAVLSVYCAHGGERDLAALHHARQSFGADNRNAPTIAALKPSEESGMSGAYLNEVLPPPPTTTLQAAIFDDSISREMNERNAYNLQYDDRENYHLNSNEDRRRWLERNQDIADWAMKKLIHHHLEENLLPRIEKSLKKKASEKQAANAADGGGQTVAQAANTVYSVHKALKGTKLSLGGGAKGKFRFDLPKGLLEFGLASPVLDTDVQCKLYGANRGSDMVGNLSSEPERLTVKMHRPLVLDAGAHADFGLISETLSYGVSKRIMGPVSANVDQSKHFNDSSKDELIYRLNFGASF